MDNGVRNVPYGRPLDAERLPYIVIPPASAIWDHFRDTQARPIEDHDDAVVKGEELARKFVGRMD
ncbi:hypothetical protein ACWEIK_25765 [Streptomyces sp. NPDC004673]